MNTKTFPHDRSIAVLSFRGIHIAVSIEEFDVDSAGKAIATTAVNRPLSRPHISKIVAAINRNEWMFNGETIVFDKTHALIQGQHRLSAVIASGKSIVSLVVRGVDTQAFKTFDCGKSRAAPDTLAIEGHKNTHRLAAGARCYLRLTEGTSAKSTFTPSVTLKIVKDHPALVKWAGLLGGGVKFLPSMIIGVLARAEELHPHIDYETFFLGLASGIGLTPENPAYLLRERFITRKAGQQFSEDMNIALCVKAINAFTTGARMKMLKVALNDETVELV